MSIAHSKLTSFLAAVTKTFLANDLVDALNRLRSIRQRRHGLRATAAVDFSNAEQRSRSQCRRLRARRDQADARHPCNLPGNCGHQERGGKRRTSAGHITTDRGERAHNLSEFSPANFPSPFARHPPLAEAANISSGATQRTAGV